MSKRTVFKGVRVIAIASVLAFLFFNYLAIADQPFSFPLLLRQCVASARKSPIISGIFDAISRAGETHDSFVFFILSFLTTLILLIIFFA